MSSCQCDLSLLLHWLYGDDYIDHSRLESLVEKNSLTHPNFLKGSDEAKAFENSKYVKLYQSTLCKVDILSNIVDRAADGTLKTNARLKEIYGGYLAFAMEKIKEHWLFSLISFAGAITSIIALILYIF